MRKMLSTAKFTTRCYVRGIRFGYHLNWKIIALTYYKAWIAASIEPRPRFSSHTHNFLTFPYFVPVLQHLVFTRQSEFPFSSIYPALFVRRLQDGSDGSDGPPLLYTEVNLSFIYTSQKKLEILKIMAMFLLSQSPTTIGIVSPFNELFNFQN